jgi:hypothetical protein
MKFLNWFLFVYWLILGIAVIAGFIPTTFTIVCGFWIAALGFLGFALRD